MKKRNMYWLSEGQWNPFAGCRHGCSYCISSFQKQQKRQKNKCLQCYNFSPHTHPKRLKLSLPRTRYMKFIFTCSSGDIAYCPTAFLMQIITRIRQYPDRYFLIQTKDPLNAFFRKGKQVIFPQNTILGITLETNRDRLYSVNYPISNAPLPSQRYKAFLKVTHPTKMVTIEPILDFDLNTMVNWIDTIDPCMVWLGYDSGSKYGKVWYPNYLPEPELKKTKELFWQLSQAERAVILKTIRKAWWE